jgi:hypothetical protein
MIGLVLNLLILGVFMLLTGVYVKTYITDTDATTPWHSRLWAALLKSWVILWQAAIALAVGMLDVIGVGADVLNAGAGDQLKANVPAKYVAALIVGIAGISIIARLRTLWTRVSG